MQRKAQREGFVSMFRGVPCKLAAGTTHDLNCSNGDLLALLFRLCGVENQDYAPAWLEANGRKLAKCYPDLIFASRNFWN